MIEENPQVGQLSAHTEALTVKVLDATTTVRREDREDIAVFANNPGHWLVADGAIRQTSVTPVVVQIFNYPVIPLRQPVGLLDLLVSAWRRLFHRDTVQPAEAPPAVSPEPTPPAPVMQQDRITIVLPSSFAGDIAFSIKGDSALDVSDFEGGNFKIVSSSSAGSTIGHIRAAAVELQLSSNGSHTTGTIESRGDITIDTEDDTDLTTENLSGQHVTGSFSGGYGIDLGDIVATGSVSLTRYGDGNITVGDIQAEEITLDLNGDGSHTLGKLTAKHDVNLTQADRADVTIDDISGADVTGTFNGDYAIILGDVAATGAVSFSRYGDGDITVGDIDGQSVKLDLNGDGSHNIGYCKAEADIEVDQADRCDITTGDMQGRNVTLNFNGDYKIDTGVITAALDLKLTRNGDGDIDVDGLNGGDIEAEMYGNGSHDLGDIKGESLSLSHNDGDSGLDISTVQVASFVLRHSSDGQVDIQQLDTDAIDIECSGEGDVTIYAGSAKSGRVYNDGDLKLSLTGRFGYLSHDNDGDGRLKIAIVE